MQKRKEKTVKAESAEVISENITEQESNQEQEYIVLNRQEEEAAAEEAPVRRLADYASLAKYQYFDTDILRKDMRMTKAIRQKGEKLYQEKKVRLNSLESGYVEDRNEVIAEAVGEGSEGRISFPVHIVFNRESVLFSECQCAECRRHYYTRYYRKEYCAYLAAFMMLVEEQLREKNLGDATDKRAVMLIQAFSEQRANSVVSDTIGRAESLTLIPRVTLKYWDLSISFKVGEKKLFVIKDLFEFYQNVQESRTAAYGTSTSFNHNISNFTENSRKWIDFIGRIVKEELAFEQRMIEARNYTKKAASKNAEFALFGWRLDEFYRLMGEDGFEYEDRDSDTKVRATLHVKEQNPKIAMTIRKNDLGERRGFHGVSVDCRMPHFYYGVGTAYYVDEDDFCKLDEEFQKKIRTIARFCPNGSLNFQVGRNNLAQFYYSVLPQLEGVVDIMEENAEEIAAYLPPQAKFVFYLDAE